MADSPELVDVLRKLLESIEAVKVNLERLAQIESERAEVLSELLSQKAK